MASVARAAACVSYPECPVLRKNWDAHCPARPEFRPDLASSQNSRGTLKSDTVRATAPDASYRDALALQKQLADDFPARPEFRRELAASHTNLGVLLRATDRPM